MAQKTDHIVRIALIGPESTAKSTLSEELAHHYNTVWVNEHSRAYLEGMREKYTLADILAIAKQQLQAENELLKKANNLLFADTELIISKVWCEDVFQSCPEWILENILPYRYDLYLLTYPDLEWKEDPLRENPYRRMFFYDWYERELNAIGAAYVVIKGSGDERFRSSLKAVEDFLQKQKNNL
jgi:NadR type nicotinamide-nucleotide adenylyltransferase